MRAIVPSGFTAAVMAGQAATLEIVGARDADLAAEVARGTAQRFADYNNQLARRDAAIKDYFSAGTTGANQQTAAIQNLFNAGQLKAGNKQDAINALFNVGAITVGAAVSMRPDLWQAWAIGTGAALLAIVGTPAHWDSFRLLFGAMAAFDKKDGKTLWQAKDFTDGAQYSSIVKATINKEPQYVQLTQQHIVGISAKDGALLWQPFPGLATIQRTVSRRPPRGPENDCLHSKAWSARPRSSRRSGPLPATARRSCAWSRRGWTSRG